MESGDGPVNCGTVEGTSIEEDRVCFGHRVASRWPLVGAPEKCLSQILKVE